jgi:hypothetical protein
MRLQRAWVTPLTIGTFTLLGVTGVLMFFHLDSGLNKAAHEWLSWLLLAGAAGHAAVNWGAFRHHLAGWRGRLVIGASLALLAVSFAPAGARERPPPYASVRALASAPLAVLAQVARVSPAELRRRLVGAGLQPAGDADTVQALAGNDAGHQARVLAIVLASPGS